MSATLASLLSPLVISGGWKRDRGGGGGRPSAVMSARLRARGSRVPGGGADAVCGRGPLTVAASQWLRRPTRVRRGGGTVRLSEMH